jgi:hypothetical protein
MIKNHELQLFLRERNYYKGPIDGEDSAMFKTALAWCARDRLGNIYAMGMTVTRETPDIEREAIFKAAAEKHAQAHSDIASWPIEKIRLLVEQMFLRSKGFQDIVVNGEESSETTAAMETHNTPV